MGHLELIPAQISLGESNLMVLLAFGFYAVHSLIFNSHSALFKLGFMLYEVC